MIIAMILLIAAAAVLLLSLAVNDAVFRPIRSSERWTRPVHEDYAQINREVQFPSGRVMLTGYVYEENNRKGLIIFVHGMGVPSDYYIPEILYFAERGYKVFAFNDTGYWRNGGRFHGLPQAVKDLDSAIRFVDDGTMPITLIGHSMGGYAVCAALNSSKANIQSVVAVAGFSELKEVLGEYAARAMKYSAGAFTEFIWTIQKLIFGSLAKRSAVEAINASDAKVLIAHGSEDEEISLNGSAIYAKRSQITNPNVSYKLYAEEGFHTHTGVIRKCGTKSEVNLSLLRDIEDFIAEKKSD